MRGYTKFTKLWAAISGGGEVSREGRVWGYAKFTKLGEGEVIKTFKGIMCKILIIYGEVSGTTS